MAELNFECPFCGGNDLVMRWIGQIECKVNDDGTIDYLHEEFVVDGFLCPSCECLVIDDDDCIIEEEDKLVEWLRTHSAFTTEADPETIAG